jgi:hypothetical protein
MSSIVNFETVGCFANTEDYKSDEARQDRRAQRKWLGKTSSNIRCFAKRIVTNDVEAFIAASRGKPAS